MYGYNNATTLKSLNTKRVCNIEVTKKRVCPLLQSNSYLEGLLSSQVYTVTTGSQYNHHEYIDDKSNDE